MAYEPRPNTGTLFENDRKKGPRDPDMTGSVLLGDGREYWVSAWWNQSKDGETHYLKFNIGREKEVRDLGHERQGRPGHPAQRNTAQPPMGHRDPLPKGPGYQGPGDPWGQHPPQQEDPRSQNEVEAWHTPDDPYPRGPQR